MKTIQKIRVGGVPEHFNYPFQIGVDRGFFIKHGIELEWTDISKGTGAMVH
jgi:ABC-type nitrate/sulfonate/bicarbonate transport system substrate-binding protein